MLPDIDIRLRNVAKAIGQVVLPALPVGEKLAREQCSIALGHLRVLELQWKYALPVARLSLENLLTLAAGLEPLLDEEERAALRPIVEAARAVKIDEYDAIDRVALALGAAIEPIVDRRRRDDGHESRMAALVISHSRRQARIERSWFAATGFDPAPDIPSIPEMLAREDTAG